MATQQKSAGFYVRINGSVRGPVDASELKRLALNGEIVPTDEVSRDLENWAEAGQYAALKFGKAVATAPHSEAPPPIAIPPFKRRPSLEFFGSMYFICGCLMCAVSLVLVILFIVAMGTGAPLAVSAAAVCGGLVFFFIGITCFAIGAAIAVFLENAENLHVMRHSMVTK